MPRTRFSRIPKDGRLWIFASERSLTASQEERLLAEVDRFLDGWNAHGHPLTGAREWRDGRFLLVAVDERSAPPSGCSIDAMVGVLKTLERDFEVELTGHGAVYWRDGGEVRRASRPDFAKLADSGEVDRDTPVFDLTLTRVGELRAGKFEVPARAAWHGRAFWREATGGAHAG